MSDLHQGGCQCGAVRYQFRAPLRDIAHCHCSICRRSTGGILVTWITVPLAAFTWLRGEPARFASSPSCERYFCSGCGAHLALFTTLSPRAWISPSPRLTTRSRPPPTGISGPKAGCPGWRSTPGCPKSFKNTSTRSACLSRRRHFVVLHR